MVVEKFQIDRAKITGKYICKSKNWICSFLLMPTSKTLPQAFIIIPNSEGNCSFLLNSVFWRSIFSPAERGVGCVYVCLCVCVCVCVCVGVGRRGGERWGRGEVERGGRERRGRGFGYKVEKITKIKSARVLVTSFDKFHNLCNL